MSGGDEWGPWIRHDGRGCPCEGRYVQITYRNLKTNEGVAGRGCKERGIDLNSFYSCWVWADSPRDHEIIRYRIRKPKGLTILQSLLANLPEQVDA